MSARSDAQRLHERRPGAVLELDLDYCDNVFGVEPCAAGRTGESGTAQAGAASTLTLRAAASAVDDAFNGLWLGLRSGAGSIQARKITDYVGATKVATVDKPWRVNRLSYSAQLDQWVGAAPVATDQARDAEGKLKLDTLTDDNASSYLNRNRSVTVPNDGATYIIEMDVVKDLSATHRAGLNIGLVGGTPVHINPRFALDGSNLATCTVTQIPASGSQPAILRVRMSITNNSSGNTTFGIEVYPATAATKGGADNVAGVGSITCGRVHVRTSAESEDYIEAGAAAVVAPNNTTVYDLIDRANACYNVFTGDSPCQDRANYVKGVKTVKFCQRGMRIPPGELVRPLILTAGVKPTATEISTDKGLAMRSQTSVELADEPCRDDLDKYVDDRAAPAGGTFWPRLLARNPNAAGRPARLRRGYVVAPWSWDTFQTELFIIEALRGPARSGNVTAVITDLVKLLDRTMIPAPTDGKLLADLPAVSDTGTARGGTLNTIVLREKASAVDDVYNGQEVFILENTGAGRRRVISDYEGATRTATLAVNWQVTPDTTSTYEVCPLEFTLAAGKGAQYPAPGAEPEFLRLGDEVIRYTARSGDTLSWADGSYRAQFGTPRAEHKAKAGVQLCRVWVDKPFKTVVQNLLNEGGAADGFLDLAQLASEDTDWLGLARITACIADPERSSELYADLLKDAMMMSWWHPVEQKQKFKVDMPALGAAAFRLTDDQLMLRETDAQRLDGERITRAALDFELAAATADRKKRTNYRTIELFIDDVAEGPNAYDDVRQHLRASRWFTEANEVLAKANVARKLRRLGAAPWRVKFKLDPKDELVLGQLADLTTRKIPDASGRPKLQRCRVTRLVDRGAHFEAELRTTGFEQRYAFIAPNGQPDYGAASAAERAYAYISNGAAMSDGSSAYLII